MKTMKGLERSWKGFEVLWRSWKDLEGCRAALSARHAGSLPLSRRPTESHRLRKRLHAGPTPATRPRLNTRLPRAPSIPHAHMTLSPAALRRDAARTTLARGHSPAARLHSVDRARAPVRAANMDACAPDATPPAAPATRLHRALAAPHAACPRGEPLARRLPARRRPCVNSPARNPTCGPRASDRDHNRRRGRAAAARPPPACQAVWIERCTRSEHRSRRWWARGCLTTQRSRPRAPRPAERLQAKAHAHTEAAGTVTLVAGRSHDCATLAASVA